MKRNDTPAPKPPQTGRQRLDKWLWVARFYKTRSLAAQAVEKGHVKVCGERVKPAHPLRPGEQVSLRRQGLAWSVDVLAFSDRRGSAAHAAELYRETPQSLAAREQALVERKAARASEPGLTARPTKRDRRKLEDFLNEP